MTAAFLLLFAYLFGSVPFGLLLGKRVRNIDIRDFGSGNIGATNVLRTLGPGLGFLSFILDVLKGFLPVFAAGRLGLDPVFIALAGVLAVVGHTFSVFLKFKGGKGVSSSLGAILGFNYIIGLLGLLLFIIIVAVSRYVSLGSCIAAFSVFVMTLFWQAPPAAAAYKIMTGIVFAVILFKHIPNIKRLISGTENRFGQRTCITSDTNRKGEKQ